jgi:putative addiction module component (TIGR02574 family)
MCVAGRRLYRAGRRLVIIAVIANRSPGVFFMSPLLKSLGIDQLSVAERILLAEEIWDSIPDEAEEPPLTESQKQDLQCRLAAYEANPKAGSGWEEVKARLRGRP